MDLKKLIGDKSAVLPEALLPVIEDLASGEIVSLVVLLETQSGHIGDLFMLDLNDSASNRFAVLGGLVNMQRDFMRLQIESRVPYVEEETDD